MTWFGGIWFVASAVRVNDKTITIRANDVINIKILGAKERTVSRNNSVTDVETFPGLLSEKTDSRSVIVCHAPVLSNVLIRHFVVVLIHLIFH